jgi:hypothetical protein
VAKAMTLAALLALDISPWAKNLDKAKGQAKGFSGGIQSAFKAIGPIAAALGAAIGAGAIVAGIKRTASEIDGLTKSADSLQISTEALGGLHHAVQLTGGSAQLLNTALATSARTLGEAAHGAGASAKWIDRMGLSVQDLQAMSPDERFRAYAQGMQSLSTQGERAAASAAIFGDSQGKLLPLLSEGADGIKRLTQEASDLGLTFNRVDAAKVEQANDALTRVSSIIKGQMQKATIALAPIIEGVANHLLAAGKSGLDFGEMTETALDHVASAVGFVANSVQGIQFAWSAAQVGVSWAMANILEGANNVIKAFNWWSVVGGRVWDLLKAGFSSLGATVSLMWTGMQVPVAMFVQFIGRKMAEMLSTAAKTAGVFSETLAAKIQNASFAIQRSTGDATAQAQKQFREATAEANTAGLAIKSAWDELGKPIERQGSESIALLASSMREVQAARQDELQDLRRQRLASDVVAEGYRGIRAAAEAAALATAAKRASPDAGAIVPDESDQLEESIERHRDYQRSLSEIWADGMEERAQFSQMSAWGQSRTILGAMEATTRGVAKQNKAMFLINQGAGIANATMNTAEGMTLAMAKYAGPQGIAMAGLIGAAGALQIAAIAKTKFGGGGRPPSVSGSMPHAGAIGGGIATDPEAMDRPATGTSRPSQLVLDRSVALDPVKLADAVNQAGRDGYTFDGITLR